MNLQRGFTYVEIMISLFVLVILGAIGASAFYNARNAKTLDVLTDGMVFTLEQARTDALAGKNASVFGVYFASTSYSYFSGSTYTASDPANKLQLITDGWRISTSTSDGASQITFSRLTGAASANATVTVSNLYNPALSRSIIIATPGSISVLK